MFPPPVNRVANNGLKPFEMLFKASRCDDLDVLKTFTGEFNIKLKVLVSTHTRTHKHAHTQPHIHILRVDV